MPAQLQDRLADRIGNPLLHMSAAAAFRKPLGTFAGVTLDPLVAGFSADAIALAQRADAVRPAQGLGNEQNSLVHRFEFTPGHGLLPLAVAHAG
ncbi:hypothetical protein D9M69_593180 [compost metagenome]